MEQYEDILNLIIKWFEAVLNTKINSLDDFEDGQIYLEVLNKCEKINISKDKCQNYEILEIFLDKFYKMKTNIIIDYEQVVYDTVINTEDLICICVLIFGIYSHLQHSPRTLSESNYQLLLILYKPIDNFLKNNIILDRKSIMDIITKISEKDSDDFSVLSRLPYSSKSSVTETTHNLTDDRRRNEKQLLSDEEMDNSFNIQSVTSETSYTRLPISTHLNCFSNQDSISNLANHDDSRDFSRHRRMKGSYNHRKVYNQLHLSSQVCYRKNASPKITLELKKQESKRIANIERDNKNLKDDLYHLQGQFDELNIKLDNSDISLKKIKIENQKLKDKIDECDAQLTEKEQKIFSKDKEVERISNLLNQVKKEKQEKTDEIKQMKNTIKDLHDLIDELNKKVQSGVNDYDEVRLSEIEYLKLNENLKNENQKLKSQIEENEIELQNLRYRDNTNNRDQYVESPIPDNVEVGESMDVINEFKCAEMEVKFSKEIEEYQKEVKVLKEELDKNNKTMSKFKSELEVLDQKYKEALSEIRIYSSKLDEANKELMETQENIIGQNCNQLPDIKHMRFQGIVEMFRELLSDNELQFDEKKLLVKFISRELNVDLFDDDRYKSDIISLNKNVADLKQSNERKILENERLQIQYEDLGHHYQILSEELESEKIKNDDLTRYYQVQKAKIDDDLFKTKMTLNNVQEEKTKLHDKYCDMKRDFLRCENNLLKSNDEFNTMREAYDKCLQSLKEFADDCHDYEEVIKEITAREQKIYRNISCQTDRREDIVSTGTNVMSPRTPNYLNKSQSLRKHGQSRQFNPEPINLRQSPLITLSNSIIANKSLHNLRQNDSHTTKYGYRGSPDIKIYQPNKDYNQRSYVNGPDTKVFQKCDEQNSFRNQTFDRCQKVDSKLIDKKLIKGENKYTIKKDSPLVKPERLNQIWSRNDKQPAHLKSSYPVETQGVELGYVAGVYLDKMKVPLSDSDMSEVDHDNDNIINTGRSTNSRRYTNVDPLNFRSDMKNRGLYQYSDDVMVDDLLKRNNNTGVLSARSGNSHGGEKFKKPLQVPQLKLAGGGYLPDRDSDCENRRPLCEKNDYEDKRSVTSSSICFDIVNSPKLKSRGFPRGSVRVSGER